MKEERTESQTGVPSSVVGGATPGSSPAGGAGHGRRRRGAHASSATLRRMVALSVFAALAYGVTFVLRIKVGFLTFDAKDAVLTIAALIYGPVAGVVASLLTALLELLTVSDTGLYGFLMNFTSSAVFSAMAAWLYRLRRRPAHAAISLYTAALTMTGAMLLMNLAITPFYMGVERGQVVAMLPTLLLPFNLAKGLMNAALAMLLYKPTVTALRRAGLAPRHSAPAPVPPTPASAAAADALSVTDAPGVNGQAVGQPGTAARRDCSLWYTVGMLAIALVTLCVAVAVFLLLRARLG